MTIMMHVSWFYNGLWRQEKIAISLATWREFSCFSNRSYVEYFKSWLLLGLTGLTLVLFKNSLPTLCMPKRKHISVFLFLELANVLFVALKNASKYWHVHRIDSPSQAMAYFMTVRNRNTNWNLEAHSIHYDFYPCFIFPKILFLIRI